MHAYKSDNISKKNHKKRLNRTRQCCPNFFIPQHHFMMCHIQNWSLTFPKNSKAQYCAAAHQLTIIGIRLSLIEVLSAIYNSKNLEDNQKALFKPVLSKLCATIHLVRQQICLEMPLTICSDQFWL